MLRGGIAIIINRLVLKTQAATPLRGETAWLRGFSLRLCPPSLRFKDVLGEQKCPSLKAVAEDRNARRKGGPGRPKCRSLKAAFRGGQSGQTDRPTDQQKASFKYKIIRVVTGMSVLFFLPSSPLQFHPFPNFLRDSQGKVLTAVGFLAMHCKDAK